MTAAEVVRRLAHWPLQARVYVEKPVPTPTWPGCWPRAISVRAGH